MDPEIEPQEVSYTVSILLHLAAAHSSGELDSEDPEVVAILREAVSRVSKLRTKQHKTRRDALTVDLVEEMANAYRLFMKTEGTLSEEERRATLESTLRFHVWTMIVPDDQKALRLNLLLTCLNENDKRVPLTTARIKASGGPVQCARKQLATALGEHWKTYLNREKRKLPRIPPSPVSTAVSAHQALVFAMSALGFRPHEIDAGIEALLEASRDAPPMEDDCEDGSE